MILTIINRVRWQHVQKTGFHSSLLNDAANGSPMVATTLTKNDRALWILLVAVVATVALYVVPYGHYVAYPLVLLSTYAHEMGHGITALLVGGRFEAFVISPDGSGLAYLQVPESRLARAATSAGGLIGPAVLAALFFWLARNPKTAHMGLAGFGVATLAALVLVVRNPFGWVFVGALGTGCVYLGIRSSARAAQWVLAFMAVQLSLSVFSRSDYLFTETAGAAPSDVAQMATSLLLPYWFWGIVCGAVSVLALILGIKTFVRAT